MPEQEASLAASLPKVRDLSIAEDGTITCQTDPERPHTDVAKAYEDKIHSEFLNLKSDDPEVWRGFIYRWGPLWPMRSNGSGTWNLRVLREEQALLAALVNLHGTVVRGGSTLSSHLHALVNAVARFETECSSAHVLALFLGKLNLPAPPPLPAWEDWPRSQAAKSRNITGGFTATPAQWIENGKHSDRIEFARRCLRRYLNPLRPHQILIPQWGKDPLEILEFGNLLEAIHWMIWNDARTNPIEQCKWCGKFFRSDNKHRRSFCSGNCRSRSSTQTFRQKQKREKQNEDKNRSAKGESDGRGSSRKTKR